MAANFPTSKDTFRDVTDNIDSVIASDHNNPADVVEALEDKVGIDSSVDTSSLDYKIRNLPAQDSDTKVTNLNAAKLNGSEASSFFPARSGDIILSSNVSTPSGWSDVSSTYNNKFIRISSSTPLSTGGVDSHSHTAGSYIGPSHNHTTTIIDGGNEQASAGDGLLGNYGEHEHTISSNGNAAITGVSATSNNVPAYIQIKMYKKD